MDELSAFTPEQREQILAIVSKHVAPNAEIKVAATVPPRDRLIGRIGGFYLFALWTIGTNVLTALLVPSDTAEAYSIWKPRAVSACEQLTAGMQGIASSIGDCDIQSVLDDHPNRHLIPNQHVAEVLPGPTGPLGPTLPTGTGNIVVTPGTAELHLKTYSPTVVISQGTPANVITLEGTATISVSGTLS